jgi:hypothetical protein
MSSPPEVWLRGPITGVPPLLQPVAHSLLQSREDVAATLPTIGATELWVRPADIASAGYHVLHAAGSLDRLFTYARGEGLSDRQRAELTAEKANAPMGPDALAELFDRRVELALLQLRATPESSLTDHREVGRARMPSTVIGLLFHAAEHTLRHVGQLITTVKVVRGRVGSAID